MDKQCNKVTLYVSKCVDILGSGDMNVVHMTGSGDLSVDGFYCINWHIGLKACIMERCLFELAGPMQVIYSFELYNERTDPQLSYDNYCRGIQCYQYYGCSYTSYATHLIDFFCHHSADHSLRQDCCDLGHTDNHCLEPSHAFPPSSSCQFCACHFSDDKV